MAQSSRKTTYDRCVECEGPTSIGKGIWVVDAEHQYPFFCSDLCLVKRYWRSIKERRDADKES